MSIKKIKDTFARMYRSSQYRIWLYVLGIFTLIPTFLSYKSKKGKDRFAAIKAEVKKELDNSNLMDRLSAEAVAQVRKKDAYFNKNASENEVSKQAGEIAKSNFEQILQDRAKEKASMQGVSEITMASCFSSLIDNKFFFAVSLVVSFPMYILMVLFMNPISKYITDRLFMMIFVLFGVTFLVFTILYISPMDPAVNILGQTATPDQVDAFNRVYGLDKPYLFQLFDNFKNLATFNLGNSYQGNENVAVAIANKFPVTMSVAFWAVLVSVTIAIPSGIISAIKQYSSFDYIFMFIALIGLSIPNFWLGLILIL
ncbi:MAG: ABC transporter permease, partial [Oscillospiraceae bacterium]